MSCVVDDQFSVGTESSRIGLSFKALIVAEATPDEWATRNKKTSHISKGEIVVEIERVCLPIRPGALLLNIEGLISSNLAHVLLVTDHVQDDHLQPICVAVNRNPRIVPLRLLPIALHSLANEK